MVLLSWVAQAVFFRMGTRQRAAGSAYPAAADVPAGSGLAGAARGRGVAGPSSSWTCDVIVRDKVSGTFPYSFLV